MADGGMTLRLSCCSVGCTATLDVGANFRMTKLGMLRLMAYTPGWYVDGGTVACPLHCPSPLPRAQFESWTEYDERVNADEELGAELRGRRA